MTLDDELRQLMQELTDEEAAELLSAVSAPIDPDAEARIRRSVLGKRMSVSGQPVIRRRFRLLATAAAVVCPVILSVAAVYLLSRRQQIPPVLPNDPALTAETPAVQTDVTRSESLSPDGTDVVSVVTAQTTVTVSVSTESVIVVTKDRDGTAGTDLADTDLPASSQTDAKHGFQRTAGTRQTTTTADIPVISSEPPASTTKTTASSVSSVTTTASAPVRSSLTTSTAPAGPERDGGEKGGEGITNGGEDEGSEDVGSGGIVIPTPGGVEDETTTTTTTTTTAFYPRRW